MPTRRLILLLFCCGPFILSAISVDRKPRKEKPATFPPGLTDSARALFIEQFERGQALYTLHCAECHDREVAGRTVIPDFSLPQLLDYEMRMQYPEHGQRLNTTNVSAEELDAIQAFLQYRERSGVPLSPPPKLPPSQQ